MKRLCDDVKSTLYTDELHLCLEIVSADNDRTLDVSDEVRHS
jgi:hypothetical protein